MKRTILLILSFAFLGLWIAGLFSTERSTGIHIALIVALLFLFRSMMVVDAETPSAKKAPEEAKLLE